MRRTEVLAVQIGEDDLRGAARVHDYRNVPNQAAVAGGGVESERTDPVVAPAEGP